MKELTPLQESANDYAQMNEKTIDRPTIELSYESFIAGAEWFKKQYESCNSCNLFITCMRYDFSLNCIHESING